MSNRARLSYEALVVCEDIRMEFDNKRTLVGVYTSNSIAVPQLPFQVVLAVFAAAGVEKAGAFRPSIRVTDRDGETIYFEDGGREVVLNEGRLNQSLFLPMDITKEGLIKFTMFDGDRALAASVHYIKLQKIEVGVPEHLV